MVLGDKPNQIIAAGTHATDGSCCKPVSTGRKASRANFTCETSIPRGVAIAIDKANTLDKKNLSFVGVEIDIDYYNAALKRIQQYKQQTTLF